MTAKRKLLLVAIAAAVVLAGGAFAWKNGKGSGNPAAVGTATKPGERPIELISAELSPSSRAAWSTSCASPAPPSRSTRRL